MKQKFLFPLNYNYSGKLLGIIEYKLLLPIFLYGFSLYLVINLFNISSYIKIITFIILFLPTTLMLNSRINSEPFYMFLFAVIKHTLNAKIYLYKRVIWCGINPNCITD